ncbi:hypothetical protein ASPZODRAFT_12080 [Penicilliopsis zonata CBS 506.65]|uniref:Uncharacterized protein n=1 Tax=Penicilliopsis zonata CBS 506.65 TaxID=1073090 RepID=A0A1L9SVW0_9EURO|nr:hypothetical protein ASPZODRAFT_12080 [Penicilliopsis zonata CBS 506.65]OJJ51241.1 hypothetical protein ASPZODRAFT_12080 [Penicilliopsis zonata CBS 506.65]
MSSSYPDAPKNPTVEDVDEQPGTDNNEAIPSWLEICSRHEYVLNSHLEMLLSVKGRVGADGDVFRAVSSMAERTQKLMTQYKVLKKHLSNKNATGKSSNPFAMPDGQNRTENSTSSSTASSSKHGKKRAWEEEEATKTECQHVESEYIQSQSPQKRMRTGLVIPGNSEDLSSATPVSWDTEDISEEVQRRLKIKEERRKQRNSKSEKRKRESLTSNGSVASSVGPSKPKKKKARTEVSQLTGSSRDNTNPEPPKGKAKRHSTEKASDAEHDHPGQMKKQRKEQLSTTS